MKNILKLFLCLLLAMSLFSCGETEKETTETTPNPETESSTTIESDTEIETEVTMPDVTEGEHAIAIQEVSSILAENGLRTNLNHNAAYPAYHGGQQLRVCHTERGTYTVILQEYNRERFARYYVAKIDNEDNVSLLYYGKYAAPSGTGLVNIAQDTNGDILVTAGSEQELFIAIFDAKTDAMTIYTSPGADNDGRIHYNPHNDGGYSQAMFDFENRRVYLFYHGGLNTGDYVLEWFTFDMETKQWLDTPTYIIMEGLGRHAYVYPIPDGKGGAYMVGQRDILKSDVADVLKVSDYSGYLWDELKLFYIPDLTTSENIEYAIIEEAITDFGEVGGWLGTSMGHAGGIFMDAAGYLHITYQANPADPSLGTEYRHAIYQGLECIYNEKITGLPDETFFRYKAMITQDTSGTLYMIVAEQFKTNKLFVYKANDALGTDWTLVKTNQLEIEGKMALFSFSMSSKRNGSTQDNIISCYYYGNHDAPLSDTAFLFNLSLEDYSITKVIDVFAEYEEIWVDPNLDNRAYNSSHQDKIVHTENGTYAAFVYNYNFDPEIEYFYIVKIDENNKATVLYEDSYDLTLQDKYLTMKKISEDKVAIVSPFCNTFYMIDTNTDEVTVTEVAKSRQRLSQQANLLLDADGNVRILYGMLPNAGFSFTGLTVDTASMTMTDTKVKYKFDTEILGNYEKVYAYADGKGGAYLVAASKREAIDLTGKLEYNGHTDYFTDTITLFYVPNMDEPVIQCIDVQVPYEAEGMDGIWSLVDLSESGDVYLDADGKLHILYTYYEIDLDDADILGNEARIAESFKQYHAIYNGTELVSKEELNLDLPRDASLRMTQTTDGTLYLVVCHLNLAYTRLDVYSQTENGWTLNAVQNLGDFTAESFSISSVRGGSVQDNTVDCMIYATDNDVYFSKVVFTDK